ncbi:MAG: hypothetical protein VYE67_03435, partial [Planctomycetota bacterium]|nr:hypothetical protein [Planctomycetota bacterium]
STPLTETSVTDRLLIESSTLEISIPDFAAGRMPRHPNLRAPFTETVRLEWVRESAKLFADP